MLVVYQIGAIDTIFCFQLRNIDWILTDSLYVPKFIVFMICRFGTGALYTMGTRMLGVPDRLAHVANFTVDDVLVYKDEIFDVSLCT